MNNGMSDIILKEHEAQAQAFLKRANVEKTVQGHRVTLNLNSARDINNPMEILFPFKSVFVEQASDANTFFYLKPSNREDMQKSFRMGLKDSWALPYQIPKCFLHWDAQPGKTAELVFFADAEFRSGSQISVTSGGVSISDGSTVTGPTQAVLTAATAGIIAPQLLTRKVAIIQNKTGSDLYIGGAAVTGSGATEGIKIAPDAIIEHRNTGALYGFSIGGGNVHRLEEE